MLVNVIGGFVVEDLGAIMIVQYSIHFKALAQSF